MTAIIRHARYLADKLFLELVKQLEIKLASFLLFYTFLRYTRGTFRLPGHSCTLEFKGLQKGLNSANESSAPTGRLHNRPSLVETLERRTEGNCSFATIRSPIFDESAWRHYRRRNSAAIRPCRLSDGYRSKESVSTGLLGFAQVVSPRTNRPNSATNGYYSAWRGQLRPNRFSFALFRTMPKINSCIVLNFRFQQFRFQQFKRFTK